MGDLQSPGFRSAFTKRRSLGVKDGRYAIALLLVRRLQTAVPCSLDRACKIVLVMEILPLPKPGFPGIVPDVADAIGQMMRVPHKPVKIVPVPECA